MKKALFLLIASAATILTVLGQTRRAAEQSGLQSGPNVGDECPAFDPRHVAGPDKGTRTCPMCKYGSQQGILIWVNTDDLVNVAAMAKRLEEEITLKGTRRIRAFIVYMNPNNEAKSEVERRLRFFALDAGLSQVAVTYVPSPGDTRTSGLYRINPSSDVRNTVIVYKSRKVFDKYVNFAATAEDLDRLIASVEKAETSK